MQLYADHNRILVRKIEEGQCKGILLHSEIKCDNKIVLNWFIESTKSQ